MSRHPLVVFPEATVVLPPRLLPPAAYYGLLARYGRAAVDWSGPFRRSDKLTHRFDIADTRGRLSLTVPIAKPSGGARWADVTLSDHGRWQETIPTALESAYGRTPFFEFLAPRIIPLLADARGGDRLIDLASSLDRAVSHILGLPVSAVDYLDNPVERPVCSDPEEMAVDPYWQVRRDTLGFIPGLSILDLIFNLGPEAPLHLLTLHPRS